MLVTSDNGRLGRGDGGNDNDGGDKNNPALKVEEGANQVHIGGDEALAGQRPGYNFFETIATI